MTTPAAKPMLSLRKPDAAVEALALSGPLQAPGGSTLEPWSAYPINQNWPRRPARCLGPHCGPADPERRGRFGAPEGRDWSPRTPHFAYGNLLKANTGFGIGSMNPVRSSTWSTWTTVGTPTEADLTDARERSLDAARQQSDNQGAIDLPEGTLNVKRAGPGFRLFLLVSRLAREDSRAGQEARASRSETRPRDGEGDQEATRGPRQRRFLATVTLTAEPPRELRPRDRPTALRQHRQIARLASRHG
jgi:hypothetical protein